VVVQVVFRLLTQLPVFVILIFTIELLSGYKKGHFNSGLLHLLFCMAHLEVIGVETQVIANKRGNKVIAVIVAFMLTQG